MIDIKETADTLKAKTAKVNQDVLKASDKVVDETLAAGEQWNKVLGKALNTGVTLFGQQQELALTALEGMKEQYVTGNKRLRKLFGFKTAAQYKKAVTEKATLVEKEAKKVIAKATTKADEAVTTVENKTKKVLSSTKTEAKPTAAKKKVLSSTKTASKKVLSSTKKAPVKKVLSSTKMTATAPNTKVANDLKVINGIGPKMEKVLQAAGIKTYADLAAFDAKGLENILLKENPRYAMYNPQEWIDEAQKFVK